MSALSIQPTYPIFTDIDGQPLESGYVWIGTANLNPITNPINVYWDAALTQPAVQPIRTVSGYPSNAGTPARLYVNSDYSIQVQNKNATVVYSAPSATERYNYIVISGLPISVLDFGAVGNNVTNDTPAIQAAIDATPNGGTLVFNAGYTFYCDTRLVINKPMTLSCYGATIRFNGTRSGGQNNDAVSITSSNVKIMGGTWKEVAPSTNNGPYGITFFGVENNSVTPPTYIENVGIQDATIVDWQGYAVVFRMCQNFYVDNCDISNVGYVGVEVLSSNQGVISSNRIGDIHPTGIVGSLDNAYGIAITLNNNGNTVGRPVSHDVTITGNYVYNVKTWECIDTHGGYNISIVGNTCRNALYPIAVVSYVGGTSTAFDRGPSQCAVVGNTIQNDPSVYPGRVGLGRGIVVSGETGPGGSGGDGITVSGNTLTYCGGKNSDESLGAIECIAINNCVVTGNSINESGSNGIMMYSCVNSLVDGNSIWQIDPFNTTEFPTATATFTGNPTAADTITLNGVVCTFVATPSAINSNTAIDVLIGASQADTITNLQNILVTARDTGTATVMPNGRLQFVSFSNDGTDFVVTYRYPTRMLGTAWTVSESSTVISWDGASLSIPPDDNGAGIRVEQLSGGVTPTGQISNNFIRNPTASAIAIRGICQVSDTEIIYRNNSMSGKGVLYDIEGSAIQTCSSISNLFENSVLYDLPSIGSGATYEFFIPYPAASASGATVSVFPNRYLDGLVMSIQPASRIATVQLYNSTSGAIDLASTRFVYKYEQLRNFANYGELN